MRRSRKKQMAVKFSHPSFVFLAPLSIASTSDFYILKLFLSYAGAIPLLESSSCVKDTDEDCNDLHISNTSQVKRDGESWSYKVINCFVLHELN